MWLVFEPLFQKIFMMISLVLCGAFSNQIISRSWRGFFKKKHTHTQAYFDQFSPNVIINTTAKDKFLRQHNIMEEKDFFFYIIFSRLCGVGVFSQSHAGSPIMNINSLRIYIFLLLSFHPSWLHFLFHLDVSLQLHHNILISTTFNLFSCTFFTAQVFFPYITAGLTTVFFYHKIPQSFCSTLSTHHSLYV